MNSPDPLASSLMKSISAIINSSEMAAKLEAGTCYQLDNPISSKNSTKVNQTRRIPRKKVSHQAKPSPQLVECLQKASKSYQAISATSDVQLLKSDFHGVELEVKKSKCFSLVGARGIVIKETFSAFVLADLETKTKSFTVPKSGCIFAIRRNNVVQLVNGDQLLCASGFRTLIINEITAHHMGPEAMSETAAPTSPPSILSVIIMRKTPNLTIVAAEFDLSSYGFFHRSQVQEIISFFAKQGVERTPAGVRQSVEEKKFDFVGHMYCNLFGLAGVVACSRSYPSRVAFGLIDKALEMFTAKVSKEIWMSCSRPVDSPWLKELFQSFKNPAEADSLVRVQKELDETKVVLHKTIESLLDRGEKLDDLVSKSNELGLISKSFLKGAEKTNSCCVIQ